MKKYFWLLAVILYLVFGVPTKHAIAWVASGTPLSYSVFASGIKYSTQIAIDGSGNVYQSGYEGCCVVGHKGIAKYDSLGNFLIKFGPVDATGVAIALNGDIIIADFQQDKVHRYDSSGNFISMFGSTGTGNYQFSGPYTIAVDSTGDTYVADMYNSRVQKFDQNLVYKSTITGNGTPFSFNEGVAVDSSDNLFVLDSGNNRIQKFNSSGTYLLSITGHSTSFNYPEAITVDVNGNVYVADSGNNRIQIFDNSGVFQQEITQAQINAAVPTLTYLSGLGFQNPGTLFVGDSTRNFKILFDHNDPSVSLNALPGNSSSDTTPTITGTATDTTTVITAVEYSVDGGAYSACSADDGLFDELSETFSCTVSPALGVGSHTIDVRATDSKNNVDTAGSIASYPFSITAQAAASSSPTSAPATSSDPNSVNTHCSNLAPVDAPILVSANRNGTNVSLSYVPVSSIPSDYQLMYGYAPYDERFSAVIPATHASGILKYTVHNLVKTQDYFFWMRAMNGCAPGPWSNVLESLAKVSIVTSPSPSPSPLLSPSPLAIASPSPEPPVIQEVAPITLPVDVTISAVDTLGLPVADLGIQLIATSPTATPPAEINGTTGTSETSGITQETTLAGTTDTSGEVQLTALPGSYTIASNFEGNTQTQGMILSASTENVQIRVQMPITKLIQRQIEAPVDASYVTKAGVAAVFANSTFIGIAGFFVVSKIILSSLLPIYQLSSRSILRIPFDYIGSLMQYLGLQTMAMLAPIFPSLSRKKKQLGVVFDAITLKPIEKAYVLLFSKSGNLKTDFTDAFGKYQFEGLVPDDYELRTERNGYLFPSTVITTPRTLDFDHVYLPGEVIPVAANPKIIEEIVVPMDAKSSTTKWNKFKAKMKVMKIPSFVLSFAITGLAVWTNPNIFNESVAISLALYSVYKYRTAKYLKT